jgi:hypothetical protein
VDSGMLSVFRYSYGEMLSQLSAALNVLNAYQGAVFADLQLFPGAGAWHSSERTFTCL